MTLPMNVPYERVAEGKVRFRAVITPDGN